MDLRPYQVDAIERAREEIRTGGRRVLVVAPTGAGKTVIAASIISNAVRKGSRVLFVAHRREIINQSCDKLRKFGLSESEVGVIMGDDSRYRPYAPAQVGSIDTLRRRPKPLADLIFVDECHRILAKSYRDLIDYYDKAVTIGLTATPYRIGGQGLGDVFDRMVVVSTVRKLIDEGHLVEPRVWTVPPSSLPDLSSVPKSGGDYKESALSEAMTKRHLIGSIVEHWQKRAEGRKTVVFAASVEHSKEIVKEFISVGVTAEHLDGSCDKETRDSTLARLESGATKVLSACSLFCEGWDQPSVKCMVMARPTESLGLWLQCAGRILRPYQGQTAVILDHSGNALIHGLPQDDREFSLDTRKKKNGRVSYSTCPACYAINRVGLKVCPSCGYEREAAPRAALETLPGELVEITQQVMSSAKAKYYSELKTIADQRGYKHGWIFHKFVAKFGHPPSRRDKL